MTKKFSTMPESEGSCLCFMVDEPISAEGYKDFFLPLLNETLAKYGEVRMLIYYKDFKGWELEAAWLNLLNSPTFIKQIKKVAMINPPESEITRSIITGGDLINSIKIFKESEFQEALKWVKQTH